MNKNADIGSKFRFVILTSLRAKQLLRGAKPKVKTKSKNLIRVAQEEVEQGLVDFEIIPSQRDEKEAEIDMETPDESEDAEVEIEVESEKSDAVESDESSDEEEKEDEEEEDSEESGPEEDEDKSGED